MTVAAESDTVEVLLETVELQARHIDHLDLDLAAARRDSASQARRIEELTPSWWEQLLGDDRLWLALGIYLGLRASD